MSIFLGKDMQTMKHTLCVLFTMPICVVCAGLDVQGRRPLAHAGARLRDVDLRPGCMLLFFCRSCGQH